MSLDDYIKKQKCEDLSVPPKWATYYYDINDFKIQNKKVELLKEYYEHLKEYCLLWSSHNVKYPYFLDQTSAIQIANTKGGRMLVTIDVKKVTYDKFGEPRLTTTISDEEYNKRIKRYKIVGKQGFEVYHFNYDYEESLLVDWSGEKIYFTEDGYIYITDKLAKELKKVNIDLLGNRLSKEVIRHNELIKKYPN